MGMNAGGNVAKEVNRDFIDLDKLKDNQYHVFEVVKEKQVVQVPEVEYVPYEVPQVEYKTEVLPKYELKKEEVVVKDVKVQEEVVKVDKVEYVEKKKEIEIPFIDDERLKVNLTIYARELLADIVADLDLPSMIQEALNGAIKQVDVVNCNIINKDVTNAIIEEKKVVLDKVEYNPVNIDKPILREKVYYANNLKCECGKELLS